jgi:hypothetical protein
LCQDATVLLDYSLAVDVVMRNDLKEGYWLGFVSL